MRIPAELRDRIVAHAQRDAPNECCGALVLHDELVREVHEFENLAASPLRFEVDGRQLAPVYLGAEERGERLAIYHSHTRSAAYPSQTDVNFAANWPGVQWLIVGLANGAEPELRNFRIEGSEVAETPVEVL